MAESVLRPILLAGFIAGTIDIGAACVINSVGPVIILQAIASGVLGKASFDQGAGAAALGLALQWAMSLLIAAIFVAAGRAMPALRRRWVGAGLAYGVVILVVMNYVVVPLSAIHRFPHFAVVHFLGDLLAMLLFGLIVAFFSREPSRSQATRPGP